LSGWSRKEKKKRFPLNSSLWITAISIFFKFFAWQARLLEKDLKTTRKRNNSSQENIG